MSDEALFVNAKQSSDFIAQVEDEVVRNLLRVAVAQVGIRIARGPSVSDHELAEKLPTTPFDLLFFVQVLYKMFSQRRLLQDVLDGKTPAQASGWDDDG
ncbi:MAG: hypothetical protein JNL38_32560 [Myxococcales bacterium]|jgi:hypothetical protein|nr:hypothetical protein [Myxococcales bacterium]